MAKKKEPTYSLEIQATGTTLELIHAMQDAVDLLIHGDHTRSEEQTVKMKNSTITTKKI